ncbi:hypothetical protein ACVNIS_10355 [Sphaerotilaceae bacterium SBD11-9]
MTTPAYIATHNLQALPPSYEWDNVLFNTFWSVNDEDNPRLASAIQMISVKAAFALAVVLCEWVIARVEGHTDTRDARLRTEAARAAAIDPRYAKLPPPPPTPASEPAQFASPLRLAMKIAAYAHDRFSGDGEIVYAGTQGLAMLVDHILEQKPEFTAWLSESLRRAHQHYPADDREAEDQPPVPQEFFEPGHAWSPQAVDGALQGFLRSLDPATNPYLNTPQDMAAAGFSGVPYGRTP